MRVTDCLRLKSRFSLFLVSLALRTFKVSSIKRLKGSTGHPILGNIRPSRTDGNCYGMGTAIRNMLSEGVINSVPYRPIFVHDNLTMFPEARLKTNGSWRMDCGSQWKPPRQ